MSIIVKGMKMPSECRECPLCQYYPMVGETRCRRTGEVLASGFGTIKFSGRSEHCPLGELPEKHGKLIDASKLKETLDYYIAEAGWGPGVNEVLGWVKEFIDAEPTIVEAEGK